MDQKSLNEILSIPGNNECAECGAQDPRWSSWNIGVLLCIRCAGFHRSLGAHISKIKSLTLDSWTTKEIESLKNIGNIKAAAIYLKYLPPDYPRPALSSDAAIQQWIRAKYEYRQFIEDPRLKSSDNVEYMEIAVTEPETEWNLETNKNKHTTYLITVSVRERKGTRERVKTRKFSFLL